MDDGRGSRPAAGVLPLADSRGDAPRTHVGDEACHRFAGVDRIEQQRLVPRRHRLAHRVIEPAVARRVHRVGDLDSAGIEGRRALDQAGSESGGELIFAAIRSFGKDADWRSSTTLKASSPRLPQAIALRLASLSTRSAGATFCKIYGGGGLPCSTLEP